VARRRRAPVCVRRGLLEPLRYRALQPPAQHLALDHDPVGRRVRPRGAGPRPDDDEVRAAATQTVLALDAPAAVDDALQKRLQQKLRPRLAVLETLHPVLGVLAEG